MLYVIHIILTAVAIFLGVKLFLIYLFKVQEEEEELLIQMRKGKEELDKLRQHNDTILAKNHHLEQLHQSTASLYEISKDLSASLKFREKAPLLKNKIWNILHCRRIKVILLQTDSKKFESLTLHKIIEISSETVHDENAALYLKPQEQDYKICNTMQENNMTEILIFDTKTNFMASNMELDPHVSSFMAIPLRVKEEAIAVMTLENIDPRDIEKARIIGSQLALDIHKNQLYEQVERLSITDSLTQAYLRRHFMTRFQEELQRSINHKLPLSCLMIDIDHFKSYNDNYGHLVGDVVLKELTSLIRANVREMDLICRYGGEEFCVLLPEASLEDTQVIAERLRVDVEQRTFQAYGKELQMTISLGLASYPDQAQSVQGLIDISDQCLYHAKESGRNRVCC